MRAHYLQHVSFEGPAYIRSWLDAAGYRTTGTRFFESAALPEASDVDLLIVMGGPMSVNDVDAFPWLAPEQRFIRQVIHRGTPVLGVCLGAQLVARALGVRVYPNPEKEIGWFPVDAVAPSADSTYGSPVDGVEPSGDSTYGSSVDTAPPNADSTYGSQVDAVAASGESTYRFPKTLEVFHWHGETFDLPRGAVRLAHSVACKNQAFQIGRSVIGLQFHLETTPESARDLVEHGRAELEPSKYVQSEEEILATALEKYRVANRVLDDLLAFLTTFSGTGRPQET